MCCDSGWRDSWYYAWQAEKDQAVAQKAKGQLPCGRSPSSHFSKIRIGIQITVDCNSRIFRCFELAPSGFVFHYRAPRKSFQDPYPFRALSRLSAIEHRF